MTINNFVEIEAKKLRKNAAYLAGSYNSLLLVFTDENHSSILALTGSLYVVRSV